MQKLSIQLYLPSIYSDINKSFVSNKSDLLSLRYAFIHIRVETIFIILKALFVLFFSKTFSY